MMTLPNNILSSKSGNVVNQSMKSITLAEDVPRENHFWILYLLKEKKLTKQIIEFFSISGSSFSFNFFKRCFGLSQSGLQAT